MPRNILDRRITSYAEFFDEGGWDATNSEIPKLLFVAEKATTASRVQRTVRAALSRADIDKELEVYTTTFTALEGVGLTDTIWTNVQDPDESSSLADA